jgi:hypothetical protein
MPGPSERAYKAAQWASAFKGSRGALDAAYPIIRADVIAEVVAKLRLEGPQPEKIMVSVANYIKREFGGDDA